MGTDLTMFSATTIGFLEVVLSLTFLAVAWIVRPPRVARAFKAKGDPWPMPMRVLYWSFEIGSLLFGLGFLLDVIVASHQYGGYILYAFVLWLTAFMTAALPILWKPPARRDGKATSDTLQFAHQVGYTRASLPVVGMMWMLLACWAAAWSSGRLAISSPALAQLLFSVAVVTGVLVGANAVGILSIRWFSRPRWLMPPDTRT